MGKIEDKIIGALTGHAVGDALGMPIEGITPHERKRLPALLDKYYDPLPGALTQGLKAGQYTDDTQLLIATTESLLDEGKYNPESIARNYIDLKGINKETMTLRAPGWTTIYGIDKLRKKIIDTKTTPWNYAECGRPIEGGSAALNKAIGYILFSGDNFNEDEAKELTFMTHRSKKSWMNVLALKHISEYIKEHGVKKEADVYKLTDTLSQQNDLHATYKKELQQLNENTFQQKPYTVNTFGASAKGSAILFNALNTFLASPQEFTKSIQRGVENHDPDSVAAITGYLSGLNNGVSAITPYFLEELENVDKLHALGTQLAARYQ